MNGEFEATWQLHRFLTERDIPYVVIDGIAVQRWGEPHLTIDIELAILLPADGEERRLREIAAAFPPRLKGAVALPGFEEAAIARAVDYDLGQGRTVRLCTAEDIVVIVARQGDSLDVAHIRRWAEEFAQITEDREVVARFERAWESRLRGS